MHHKIETPPREKKDRQTENMTYPATMYASGNKSHLTTNALHAFQFNVQSN